MRTTNVRPYSKSMNLKSADAFLKREEYNPARYANKSFREVTGAYITPEGDVATYQIDVTNDEEWKYLHGLEGKEPNDEKDPRYDEWAEANTDIQLNKEMLKEPKKYGLRKVYVDAEDKDFLKSKGIETIPMTNSLFREVKPESYAKLAELKI